MVISSPPDITLEELERELSEEIRSDAEVAVALSRKALTEMQIAKALSYAESAAQAMPEWAQTHLLVARSHMGWVVQLEAGMNTPPVERAELERHIESELAETMRLARTQRDIPNEVEALLLRTDLRLLQKRSEEAEADAHEAIRLDPENVQALLALSHLHGTAKRLDESISLLERACRKGAHPEATFLYARALLQRGVPNDKQLALSLLTGLDVPLLRPELRSTVASAVVDAMVRMQSTKGAKEYLAANAEHVRKEVVTALQAHIAAAEGNKVEAEALAIQAKGELTENSGTEMKEFLARLFMRIEMFAEALPLFKQLFDANIGSFDSGQLLDCAARLHRDDIVIETCAELERRGQYPWEVASFEVQYLQKYSRERAVARLDNFLKDHPGHKLAILMRSVIGIQSQQPNLVSGKLDDLPTVEELQPDYILLVTHVLRFSGAGNTTVDYAYRFLRLHFDNIRAHQALMLSLMPGDTSITIPPTEESVAIGSAVCVHDDLNSTFRWFVLEETERPNADFEEISARSSLAQELIGKRVGDRVTLARGQMQTRTGTIRQIMPKYVRRFQDVMAEMQVRFGDRSSVEAVHVGSTKEEAAKGLEKVLESVKRREGAIREVRRIYDELPVSLHLFGDRFGKNAYIALASLAQEEGQFVKCTLGTSEERRQGELPFRPPLSWSLTSLPSNGSTHWNRKPNFGGQAISFPDGEGTFNELQETLVGDLFSGSTSATIQHRDGVATFTEETVEQKSERRCKDQEFLDRLRAAVEIVSVVELRRLIQRNGNRLKRCLANTVRRRLCLPRMLMLFCGQMI